MTVPKTVTVAAKGRLARGFKSRSAARPGPGARPQQRRRAEPQAASGHSAASEPQPEAQVTESRRRRGITASGIRVTQS
jgi:hypothetical protein